MTLPLDTTVSNICLRNLFAVRMNLSSRTAMLIYSTLGIEPRMCRCLVFKQTMYMITEDEPSYHARALYRQLSARPYRILYVGLDLQLMEYLEKSLSECWTVRAPAGCIARPFIRELKYSLLLFDEVLIDMTARELACFTRELPHRRCTPILIVKKSDNCELLTRTITRLLNAPQRAA
jgi:hypothetical protein